MLSHGSCKSQVGATARSNAHEGAVVSAQLGQSFQHGKIRFPCTVVLDALAAGDSDISKRGDEVFDERRLADTRLAGDPDNRALAAARDVPGAREAATAAPRDR